MTRRFAVYALAAALAALPFPSWAQVGRIALEAPVAPVPGTVAGAAGTPALQSVLSAASLNPGPGLVPAPSAPAAPELLTAEPASVAAQPVQEIKPVAAILPASRVVREAANDPAAAPLVLLMGVEKAAKAAPETIGALYDAAPAAPDLDALATVKTPPAPRPWGAKLGLLKPAVALVNKLRALNHERRLNALGAGERMTTEELGMQGSLSDAHRAIAEGRLQDALDSLTRLFKGRDANGWYLAHPEQRPYQVQAHAYIRFVEDKIKLAYERAHARARDDGLVAEARAAASAGFLLGHEYRRTAIQKENSAHCAHNALFNAINASAGFVYPLEVHHFVESARALLNVDAKTVVGKTGAELAALERSMGVKFGRDVGQGMGVDSIVRWASLLGLKMSSRGPPRGDEGWSALLADGREHLLSLRMFHKAFPHTMEERVLHGHDWRQLHHEVYLLGAFDSPSRGVRLYMVQDSGSGATDFYTAEELSALVDGVQSAEIRAAVRVPGPN